MTNAPRQLRNPGASRGPARGVTLAELVISLLIISILSFTMGSVMVLSSKAVGLSATHAGDVRFDDVVATIASEQRFALSVTERTPRSIAFTVADRDNDAVPESIRYAWSGVAGDPLTRQYNGAPPVVVVPKVRRFQLNYLTRSGGPASAPVPDVESDEVLLFGHNAGTSPAAVSTSAWVSQYFKPNWGSVAAGRTVKSWRVTKVEVVASKAPLSLLLTQWNFGIQSADQSTGKPLGASAWLENKPFLPSTMSSSPSWASNTNVLLFTNESQNLDASEGACLVVGPKSLSPNGYVGIDTAAGEPGSSGLLALSTNSGVGYSTTYTGRAMRVRIYGKYKYAATP